ncbi:hypothetical protein N9F76_00845 [bacterium]|nr:hypothetical protein [bacterium]
MLRPLICFAFMMLSYVSAPMVLNAQLNLPEFSDTTAPEIPLPQPDPVPNRDDSGDILKTSGKAACEAQGGVWVERGDSGFCYKLLPTEPHPPLEPIEVPDPEGPAWNSGSNDMFQELFELIADSNSSETTDSTSPDSSESFLRKDTRKSVLPVLIPLPKPDPVPNGGDTGDILKTSGKAACEAQGGVWVERGESGFCYKLLPTEPHPPLEPIEVPEPEGPAWNSGSNDMFQELFELGVQDPNTDASGVQVGNPASHRR